MAKIDISKISNFEELDADALRKIIAEYEFNDNSSELAKLRAEAQKLIKAKDDATSEAASYKKQLREKQTESEIAEQEKAEELERLKAENASYKHQALISAYKSDALSMGYGEELATKRAEAMANGDFKAMSDVDKAFLEVHDKEMQANAMRNTSRPPVGGKTPEAGCVTPEQFKAMSFKERTALYSENPELYAELSSQK